MAATVQTSGQGRGHEREPRVEARIASKRFPTASTTLVPALSDGPITPAPSGMDSDLTALTPSSFLPFLPRVFEGFGSVELGEVLADIAVLKDLYVPPIHGGLTAGDAFEDESDGSQEEQEVEDDDDGRESCAEEVGGKGSWDGGDWNVMNDGYGLGLDVRPGGRIGVSGTHHEGDDDESVDVHLEDDLVGEDRQDTNMAHMEPFERDWADKWLNGVVRRAQTWLEEHEDEDDEPASREMEAILRDATAVLAIMAGTGGQSLLAPVRPLTRSCRISHAAFALRHRPFSLAYFWRCFS